MDIGYTYGSPEGERIAVYMPPEFSPPDVVAATRSGASVEFVRISDRELDCGKVPGVEKACTSFECHRQKLGYCMCGRHRSIHDPADDGRPAIRIRRVVD